jgi:hypothetical protein
VIGVRCHDKIPSASPVHSNRRSFEPGAWAAKIPLHEIWQRAFEQETPERGKEGRKEGKYARPPFCDRLRLSNDRQTIIDRLDAGNRPSGIFNGISLVPSDFKHRDHTQMCGCREA